MAALAKNETTLEAIKDLLSRIPNLKQLIEEAEKPPVVEIAETAYIYNGYGIDVTLTHLGLDYKVPAGEYLQINGMPEYKEIDPQRSRPGAIEWFNIPLKGEFIAHELVNKHGFDTHGMAVFTETERDRETGTEGVPRDVKDRADQAGRLYWIQRIEEFKVNRSKAQAGIAGYKINPDPNLYKMMSQYSPDDVHFVQASKQRLDRLTEDAAMDRHELSEALKTIALALGRNLPVKEPKTPEPTPAPPVLSLTERAAVVGVRRLPHEKDAVFEARVKNAEEALAEKAIMAAQVESQNPGAQAVITEEPTVG